MAREVLGWWLVTRVALFVLSVSAPLLFNRGSDYPDPTIRKVKLAEVRDHLPADTPVVTPDQRVESLRARREGAQLRRIW